MEGDVDDEWCDDNFSNFVRAVAEVSVNGCWACNHGWLVCPPSGLHFSPEIRGFEFSLILGYFYSLNFTMIRKVS
jgi:hypothetical protein